jgi:hypothetical protein
MNEPPAQGEPPPHRSESPPHPPTSPLIQPAVRTTPSSRGRCMLQPKVVVLSPSSSRCPGSQTPLVSDEQRARDSLSYPTYSQTHGKHPTEGSGGSNGEEQHIEEIFSQLWAVPNEKKPRVPKSENHGCLVWIRSDLVRERKV